VDRLQAGGPSIVFGCWGVCGSPGCSSHSADTKVFSCGACSSSHVFQSVTGLDFRRNHRTRSRRATETSGGCDLRWE
jgi:hypothetical protein